MYRKRSEGIQAFPGFSRHGDADFIDAFFAGERPGAFLDIGAWHSTAFSTTRRLFERGFSGTLIEAAAGCAAQLATDYRDAPGVEVFHACVGPASGPGVFWDARGDGMSTTVIKRMQGWVDGGIAFDPQQVEMQTPGEILAKSRHATFDFVSIDTGGTSADILLQLDLGRLGARLVAVDRNGSDYGVCAHHCREWGLVLLLMTTENLFFGVPGDGACRWVSAHETESPVTGMPVARRNAPRSDGGHDRPTIVLCSGINRSGSTLLFNLAHQILLDSGTSVHAAWVDLHSQDDPADVHLVKVHDPAPWLEVQADIIFTSRRDLRDIVASIVRLELAHGLDDQRRVAVSSVEKHRYWQARTHHEFVYEDMMTNPVATVERMANLLGRPMTRREAGSTLASVDATIAASSKVTWDATTLLYPNHRGSGKINVWRRQLSPQSIAAIEEACGDWLGDWGYPLSADLPPLPIRGQLPHSMTQRCKRVILRGARRLVPTITKGRHA